MRQHSSYSVEPRASVNRGTPVSPIRAFLAQIPSKDVWFVQAKQHALVAT